MGGSLVVPIADDPSEKEENPALISHSKSCTTSYRSMETILSFLDPISKLRAAHIRQDWHEAGRTLQSWSHQMACSLTAPVRWVLPSARFLFDMTARSHDHPIGQEVVKYRSGTATATKNRLLELLSSISSVAVENNSDLNLYLSTTYFPILFWFLLCSEVPRDWGLIRSRDLNLQGAQPSEDTLSVWEVAFTLTVFPELPFLSAHYQSPCELRVLYYVSSVFHYFRIAEVSLHLVLAHLRVFDAPLHILLRAVHVICGRAEATSPTTSTYVALCAMIDDCLTTLEIIETTCRMGVLHMKPDSYDERDYAEVVVELLNIALADIEQTKEAKNRLCLLARLQFVQSSK